MTTETVMDFHAICSAPGSERKLRVLWTEFLEETAWWLDDDLFMHFHQGYSLAETRKRVEDEWAKFVEEKHKEGKL